MYRKQAFYVPMGYTASVKDFYRGIDVLESSLSIFLKVSFCQQAHSSYLRRT